MLKISGVDHLNMTVKSFSESVKFYQDVFGFEIFEEGTSMSGLEYKIIGRKNKLVLCIYEGEPNTEGINHIGLHVENFSDVLEYLDKQGVSYQYGGHVHYDKSRSVYINDPSGYEIELSENFAGGL